MYSLQAGTGWQTGNSQAGRQGGRLWLRYRFRFRLRKLENKHIRQDSNKATRMDWQRSKGAGLVYVVSD